MRIPQARQHNVATYSQQVKYCDSFLSIAVYICFIISARFKLHMRVWIGGALKTRIFGWCDQFCTESTYFSMRQIGIGDVIVIF